MSPLEIRELIKLAKEEGVRSLRVGDVQVDLYPTAMDGGPGLGAAELARALAGPKEDPEEVMFWSAGGAGNVDREGNPVAPPATGEEAPRAN